MDYDPITPNKHEEKNFETFLTEQAVINEVESLSQEIFSQHFTSSSTNLVLISGNPNSNMFTVDILNNLKKRYEAKYPKNTFESSGIVAYTDEKLNTPSMLSGKPLIILNTIIDERNKHEIQMLIQSLNEEEQKPDSISLCTLVSPLPDQEIEELGIKYIGFPLPNNILVSGYGISHNGKLDQKVFKRIIYAKVRDK